MIQPFTCFHDGFSLLFVLGVGKGVVVDLLERTSPLLPHSFVISNRHVMISILLTLIADSKSDRMLSYRNGRTKLANYYLMYFLTSSNDLTTIFLSCPPEASSK